MSDDKGSINFSRSAFLGKAAQDLVHLSSEQVAVVYEQRGLIIPVEVSSTLLYLDQHHDVVLTDIARTLSLPHQLAAQRVAKLERRGLLEKRRDPADRRRLFLDLTPLGREQAQRLETCMSDMAIVYRELYEEIGCDLPSLLNQAIDSLKARDLSARFKAAFEENTS